MEAMRPAPAGQPRLATMFGLDEHTVGYLFVDAVSEPNVAADGRPSKRFDLRLEEVSGEGASSIARLHPAAIVFEREVKDLFGVAFKDMLDDRPIVLHENWPEGVHPLRKDFLPGDHVPEADRQYPFIEGEGEGLFEIPVGPVHAGVIEPGHFRFTSVGEHVLNLETRLFYKHRGLEKLAEGQDVARCLSLVERVAGDESVSNSWAYALALEEIAAIEVSEQAEFIRQYLQELERVISHLNDLVGMATDVAFGVGSMLAASMREEALRMAKALTGSRYMMGSICPGGVDLDIGSSRSALGDIAQKMSEIKQGITEFRNLMFNNISVMDRLESTGALPSVHARRLGVVGPPARACGIEYDVRFAFIEKIHRSRRLRQILSDLDLAQEQDGDCLARTRVRIKEVLGSIKLMDRLASELPSGASYRELPSTLPANKSAIGITEAPRGETIVYVRIDETGSVIDRFHIRTPSRVNWPALPLAFEGDIVADFPLVNKSFNLSYAGNDL